MTTEETRSAKAMALLECFEARAVYRRINARLDEWAKSARTEASALNSSLSEHQRSSWDTVKNHANAIDAPALAKLLDEHRSASGQYNSAKSKLLQYGIELED